MNWDGLLLSIAAWQKRQFPLTTTYGAAAHLHREVLEIVNEAMNGKDDAEEWADALFMCIQGGTLAAGGLDKFHEVVARKLEKNQERTWPNRPDADNVYEHIK